MTKNLLAGFISFLGFVSFLGATTPALSSDTAQTIEKARVVTSVSGKTLEIGIEAAKGSHLNLDAPLKLELTGIETEKSGPFGKDSFDRKKNHFSIALKKPEAKGSMKLTYSVCDDGNRSCRRVIETLELK